MKETNAYEDERDDGKERRFIYLFIYLLTYKLPTL